VGVVGTGGLGGYLAQMLQALFALAGVCALAWGVLRLLARRGIGLNAPRGPSGVRVIERIALDARRTLFVVRAGERTLLLGTGDGGAPQLITELSPSPSDAEVTSAVREAAANDPVTGEGLANPHREPVS